MIGSLVAKGPAENNARAGLSRLPPLWIMYLGDLADENDVGMQTLANDRIDSLHIGINRRIELR